MHWLSGNQSLIIALLRHSNSVFTDLYIYLFMALDLTRYHDAGFYGTPVMLDNGNIIDSALLPGSAVEGHAVEVSEDSLLQSVTQTPPFGQQPRNQGTVIPT